MSTQLKTRAKASDFRVKVDGRRRYVNPKTHTRVESVTDILSTLYDKEALTNWKLRNQVDYCRYLVEEDQFIPFDLEDDFDGTEWDRYRDRVVSESLKFNSSGAAYGSLVHDLFEALHFGDDMSSLLRKKNSDEALAAAKDIHRWIARNKFCIVYCEVAAFHPRYAGTIDLILFHEPSKRNVVADIKTGKSIDYNTSAELQLAAYADCDFIKPYKGEEPVKVFDLNLSREGLIIHCPSDVGVVVEGRKVDLYTAGGDWSVALLWHQRRMRHA